MTVYILRTCERDEDSEILGVFADKLTAKEIEALHPDVTCIIETYDVWED